LSYKKHRVLDNQPSEDRELIREAAVTKKIVFEDFGE
jgi:hypothetical protein